MRHRWALLLWSLRCPWCSTDISLQWLTWTSALKLRFLHVDSWSPGVSTKSSGLEMLLSRNAGWVVLFQMSNVFWQKALETHWFHLWDISLCRASLHNGWASWVTEALLLYYFSHSYRLYCARSTLPDNRGDRVWNLCSNVRGSIHSGWHVAYCIAVYFNALLLA